MKSVVGSLARRLFLFLFSIVFPVVLVKNKVSGSS